MIRTSLSLREGAMCVRACLRPCVYLTHLGNVAYEIARFLQQLHGKHGVYLSLATFVNLQVGLVVDHAHRVVLGDLRVVRAVK